MASRIPALPRDSHVQSHAAVRKNKLCDSHSLCVATIVIAGGRTRPVAAFRGRQLSGPLDTPYKDQWQFEIKFRRHGGLPPIIPLATALLALVRNPLSPDRKSEVRLLPDWPPSTYHRHSREQVMLHDHSFTFHKHSHAPASERCRPAGKITDLLILSGLIHIALLWKSCPYWNKAAFVVSSPIDFG